MKCKRMKLISFNGGQVMEMRKGILSIDFGVAALLATTIFVLALHSFSHNVHAAVEYEKFLEKERNALTIADYLVKNGLVREDKQFVYSHEIDERKLLELSEMELRNAFGLKQLAIGFNEIKPPEEDWLCVKRIVLSQGKETVLRVCVA